MNKEEEDQSDDSEFSIDFDNDSELIRDALGEDEEPE